MSHFQSHKISRIQASEKLEKIPLNSPKKMIKYCTLFGRGVNGLKVANRLEIEFYEGCRIGALYMNRTAKYLRY